MLVSCLVRACDFGLGPRSGLKMKTLYNTGFKTFAIM